MSDTADPPRPTDSMPGLAPSEPAPPGTLPARTGAVTGSHPDSDIDWDTIRDNATTVTAKDTDLEPITKAAVILAAIGPEAAAEFLKSMTESSLTRTAIAISRLDRISKETLDAVIAEFILSIGTEEEVSGGSATARRLLSEVLDDNTIEKIMFDVEGGDSRRAWKKLNDVPTATLASFIGAEHPQTAAIIMSELRSDKAAGLIDRLDPEFAQQTMLRMARVPTLDPDVAEMVEMVIATDFLSAQQRAKRARRPADLIAGLMNNLPEGSREKFLEFLEIERPSFHKDVLRTMFTFNDIRSRVEPRDISRIAKEIEEATLTAALKWGKSQGNPTVDFILQNLSKRLAERLEEDVDAMPDVTPRDGEAAHQEVVRIIQEMSKAGRIQLVEDEAPEG